MTKCNRPTEAKGEAERRAIDSIWAKQARIMEMMMTPYDARQL